MIIQIDFPNKDKKSRPGRNPAVKGHVTSH